MDFFDAIERQLDLAKCVIVLWSQASVGTSRWVRAEATEALKQGKLIPVLVGECRPPLVFRQIQQLLIDPMGRLDSAATFDALEREVEAHLSKLEEFEKLPMLPTPQPVPGQLTSPRASSPEVTSEDILRAFLEGARLDIRREEIRELTTMFRGIGEIVRESFEGAGNFLRSQVYLKTELRIERTVIGPLSNNPFKFVPAYPDVARVLLLQRSKAVMDGPAAIRDTLENAEDSYLAQITAMRASVLKAFDILEASTADERARGRETLWPWAEARRLRRVLRRHAEELAAMRQAFSDGEGAIMDAYAQAYRSQVETLRADRRARGADAKAG